MSDWRKPGPGYQPQSLYGQTGSDIKSCGTNLNLNNQ